MPIDECVDRWIRGSSWFYQTIFLEYFESFSTAIHDSATE